VVAAGTANQGLHKCTKFFSLPADGFPLGFGFWVLGFGFWVLGFGF
jgi:hypothetical protein